MDYLDTLSPRVKELVDSIVSAMIRSQTPDAAGDEAGKISEWGLELQKTYPEFHISLRIDGEEMKPYVLLGARVN